VSFSDDFPQFLLEPGASAPGVCLPLTEITTYEENFKEILKTLSGLGQADSS